MLRILLQNFTNDAPRLAIKIALALHGNHLDALQLQIVVGRELERRVIGSEGRVKIFHCSVGAAEHHPALQIFGLALQFVCQGLRHFGQIFLIHLIGRFERHGVQSFRLPHPHV